MKLLVDERDVKFVLYEQLRIEELCKYPLYSSFSQDLFEMVLQEVEKLAEKDFYPANREGDRDGCRFEDDLVRVPNAYHQPYQRYREGGWLAISDPPEVGGQGFPVVLGHSCIEFLGAANWSLLMFPGLTHGAARLLQEYGTAELQERYMHKLFSGEWAGTMCMTEPQAGSDVGSLLTRATRLEDGTYRLSGQKIFISSGMHDLTENIVRPKSHEIHISLESLANDIGCSLPDNIELRIIMKLAFNNLVLRQLPRVFSNIGLNSIDVYHSEPVIKAKENLFKILRQGGIFLVQGFCIEQTQLNVIFGNHRGASLVCAEQKRPDGPDKTSF